MLEKVADFYEDEVDAAIQALTSIIEPIMMIGVGVMVGIIVIAMYLLMFKMLTLIDQSTASECCGGPPAGGPHPFYTCSSRRRRRSTRL